jgi:tight adherence protein C
VTTTALLAALAGALAAAAIVEFAAVAPRRGSRRAATRCGPARTGTGARSHATRRLPPQLVRAARRHAPAGLAAHIEAAGVQAGTGELMAVKAGAAPAALLGALPLAPLAPGRLGLALVLAAPPLGYAAPDLWLRARARARARTIEAEMADVLDLLRVAVGAGLTPWRAVAEVGRRHPGTLARELGALGRRVALGVPAAAALDRFERRCPAAGIQVLAGALRRADRLGAPPARALAALAAEARARRARRASEHAARAAPKIQLVVALLLVPSVLLLIAAALVPALGGEGP